MAATSKSVILALTILLVILSIMSTMSASFLDPPPPISTPPPGLNFNVPIVDGNHCDSQGTESYDATNQKCICKSSSEMNLFPYTGFRCEYRIGKFVPHEWDDHHGLYQHTYATTATYHELLFEKIPYKVNRMYRFDYGYRLADEYTLFHDLSWMFKPSSTNYKTVEIPLNSTLLSSADNSIRFTVPNQFDCPEFPTNATFVIFVSEVLPDGKAPTQEQFDNFGEGIPFLINQPIVELKVVTPLQWHHLGIGHSLYYRHGWLYPRYSPDRPCLGRILGSSFQCSCLDRLTFGPACQFRLVPNDLSPKGYPQLQFGKTHKFKLENLLFDFEQKALSERHTAEDKLQTMSRIRTDHGKLQISPLYGYQKSAIPPDEDPIYLTFPGVFSPPSTQVITSHSTRCYYRLQAVCEIELTIPAPKHDGQYSLRDKALTVKYHRNYEYTDRIPFDEVKPQEKTVLVDSNVTFCLSFDDQTKKCAQCLGNNYDCNHKVKFSSQKFELDYDPLGYQVVPGSIFVAHVQYNLHKPTDTTITTTTTTTAIPYKKIIFKVDWVKTHTISSDNDVLPPVTTTFMVNHIDDLIGTDGHVVFEFKMPSLPLDQLNKEFTHEYIINMYYEDDSSYEISLKTWIITSTTSSCEGLDMALGEGIASCVKGDNNNTNAICAPGWSSDKIYPNCNMFIGQLSWNLGFASHENIISLPSFTIPEGFDVRIIVASRVNESITIELSDPDIISEFDPTKVLESNDYYRFWAHISDEDTSFDIYVGTFFIHGCQSMKNNYPQLLPQQIYPTNDCNQSNTIDCSFGPYQPLALSSWSPLQSSCQCYNEYGKVVFGNQCQSMMKSLWLETTVDKLTWFASTLPGYVPTPFVVNEYVNQPIEYTLTFLHTQKVPLSRVTEIYFEQKQGKENGLVGKNVESSIANTPCIGNFCSIELAPIVLKSAPTPAFTISPLDAQFLFYPGQTVEFPLINLCWDLIRQDPAFVEGITFSLRWSDIEETTVVSSFTVSAEDYDKIEDIIQPVFTIPARDIVVSQHSPRLIIDFGEFGFLVATTIKPITLISYCEWVHYTQPLDSNRDTMCSVYNQIPDECVPQNGSKTHFNCQCAQPHIATSYYFATHQTYSFGSHCQHGVVFPSTALYVGQQVTFTARTDKHFTPHISQFISTIKLVPIISDDGDEEVNADTINLVYTVNDNDTITITIPDTVQDLRTGSYAQYVYRDLSLSTVHKYKMIIYNSDNTPLIESSSSYPYHIYDECHWLDMTKSWARLDVCSLVGTRKCNIDIVNYQHTCDCKPGYSDSAQTCNYQLELLSTATLPGTNAEPAFFWGDQVGVKITTHGRLAFVFPEHNLSPTWDVYEYLVFEPSTYAQEYGLDRKSVDMSLWKTNIGGNYTPLAQNDTRRFHIVPPSFSRSNLAIKFDAIPELNHLKKPITFPFQLAFYWVRCTEAFEQRFISLGMNCRYTPVDIDRTSIDNRPMIVTSYDQYIADTHAFECDHGILRTEPGQPLQCYCYHRWSFGPDCSYYFNPQNIGGEELPLSYNTVKTNTFVPLTPIRYDIRSYKPWSQSIDPPIERWWFGDRKKTQVSQLGSIQLDTDIAIHHQSLSYTIARPVLHMIQFEKRCNVANAVGIVEPSQNFAPRYQASCVCRPYFYGHDCGVSITWTTDALNDRSIDLSQFHRSGTVSLPFTGTIPTVTPISLYLVQKTPFGYKTFPGSFNHNSYSFNANHPGEFVLAPRPGPLPIHHSLPTFTITDTSSCSGLTGPDQCLLPATSRCHREHFETDRHCVCHGNFIGDRCQFEVWPYYNTYRPLSMGPGQEIFINWDPQVMGSFWPDFAYNVVITWEIISSDDIVEEQGSFMVPIDKSADPHIDPSQYYDLPISDPINNDVIIILPDVSKVPTTDHRVVVGIYTHKRNKKANPQPPKLAELPINPSQVHIFPDVSSPLFPHLRAAKIKDNLIHLNVDRAWSALLKDFYPQGLPSLSLYVGLEDGTLIDILAYHSESIPDDTEPSGWWGCSDCEKCLPGRPCWSACRNCFATRNPVRLWFEIEENYWTKLTLPSFLTDDSSADLWYIWMVPSLYPNIPDDFCLNCDRDYWMKPQGVKLQWSSPEVVPTCQDNESTYNIYSGQCECSSNQSAAFNLDFGTCSPIADLIPTSQYSDKQRCDLQCNDIFVPNSDCTQCICPEELWFCPYVSRTVTLYFDADNTVYDEFEKWGNHLYTMIQHELIAALGLCTGTFNPPTIPSIQDDFVVKGVYIPCEGFEYLYVHPYGRTVHNKHLGDPRTIVVSIFTQPEGYVPFLSDTLKNRPIVWNQTRIDARFVYLESVLLYFFTKDTITNEYPKLFNISFLHHHYKPNSNSNLPSVTFTVPITQPNDSYGKTTCVTDKSKFGDHIRCPLSTSGEGWMCSTNEVNATPDALYRACIDPNNVALQADWYHGQSDWCRQSQFVDVYTGIMILDPVPPPPTFSCGAILTITNPPVPGTGTVPSTIINIDQTTVLLPTMNTSPVATVRSDAIVTITIPPYSFIDSSYETTVTLQYYPLISDSGNNNDVSTHPVIIWKAVINPQTRNTITLSPSVLILSKFTTVVIHYHPLPTTSDPTPEMAIFTTPPFSTVATCFDPALDNSFQLSSSPLPMSPLSSISWVDTCGEYGKCMMDDTNTTSGCVCTEVGISGDKCEVLPCNECNPEHASMCSVEAECVCQKGWGGELCNHSQKCLDKAAKKCSGNGILATVQKSKGKYSCDKQCKCNNFFTGEKCEECSLECFNDGLRDFTCSKCGCPAGFSGDHCQCHSVQGTITLNGWNPVVIAHNNTKDKVDSLLAKPEYWYHLLDGLTNIHHDINLSTTGEMSISMPSAKLTTTPTKDDFTYTEIITIVDDVVTEEVKRTVTLNQTQFTFTFTYGCSDHNNDDSYSDIQDKWARLVNVFSELKPVQQYFNFNNIKGAQNIVHVSELTPTEPSFPERPYIASAYTHRLHVLLMLVLFMTMAVTIM